MSRPPWPGRRLGTAKNSLGALSFTRALVTGAAGLDPALRIAVPEGHGLGEVRQLVGSNEGASRKADERQKKEKHSRGHLPAPSRGMRERLQAKLKTEMEAEGDITKSVKNTRRKLQLKEASQPRKANEKPRPAPNLVFKSCH